MIRRLIILLLIVGCVFADVISVTGFRNNTSNPKNDWIGEAIADNLTTDLSKIDKIKIVSRSSLKDVLKEQKFSHSGLVEQEKSIEIGKMAGATTLLSGDYTVLSGILIINAQFTDIESGVIKSSIKVEGNFNDLYLLQKQLAQKVLEELGVHIDEKERININQYSTDNVEAIEKYYLGVIALDNNKVDNAIALFKEAISIDPYYQEAKLNYETTSSMVVSGARLFADIETELQRKESQLAALKLIMNEFINTYWKVEITGTPKPITEGGNTQYVDIKIPIKISVNIDAVEKLIVSLKSISKGNTKVIFDIDQEVVLYKENWEWFKKTKGNTNGSSWFEKIKKIVLLENDTPLIVHSLTLYSFKDNLDYYPLSKPAIWVKTNHKDLKIDTKGKYHPYKDQYTFTSKKGTATWATPIYPVNTHLLMKNIPISKVKRITSIEVR